MQGYKLKADFFILPLDNYDMVLGIKWLSRLGDIIWNFKQLQMKFQSGNQEYVLKGKANNQIQWITKEKKMKKLLYRYSQLSLTQCFAITIQNL